jgi:hypothetical protein
VTGSAEGLEILWVEGGTSVDQFDAVVDIGGPLTASAARVMISSQHSLPQPPPVRCRSGIRSVTMRGLAGEENAGGCRDLSLVRVVGDF